MMNKFMRVVAGTVFGSLLLIGGPQLSVSGQEFNKESSHDSRENFSVNRSIVGTWQTTVTPRDCETGEPVAPAFPGLLTINNGGTLTGTSSAVSSVYGIWERSRGWQDYSFAFISLRYAPTGTYIGTQTVRQAATLGATGNTFTSTGSVEFRDASGNILGTGCSTSVGTRFE